MNLIGLQMGGVVGIVAPCRCELVGHGVTPRDLWIFGNRTSMLHWKRSNWRMSMRRNGLKERQSALGNGQIQELFPTAYCLSVPTASKH